MPLLSVRWWAASRADHGIGPIAPFQTRPSPVTASAAIFIPHDPFPTASSLLCFLFSLVSRPLLLPSSVPGNKFCRVHSWNVLRMELFEYSPFIYITLLLHILLMYSTSNGFDISFSPQIPYDTLALHCHLDARSRLVPRCPRSRIPLFLHHTCLRSLFRHQHLISPISYLALPPEPWGWFDPLAHTSSHGCPGSCLLDLFSSCSWKHRMRVNIQPIPSCGNKTRNSL
jgi:hypothetical protein